ncbi:dihydrolipoamide dehydrogenase [Methylohalomonas lacus]|uniref:Dihydrolipoyl dehydrogenase n=1 Tax=Methylohalomonas lacus TaxID=398773 RepID=A0AAE3L3V6_9GAMM|nr:dihydrolipoyl dehydrogenase [Methylohalomonas lacus]MCS3902843.1 dihydrolipoamide dehydrogenase [Methylohalomonas lacus]
MNTEQTELLVLGAGPGGYTAAFRAADLGKRVTLVERYPVLGGVCLNVGCIPSKALLHIARVIAEVGELGEHGIDLGIDLQNIHPDARSIHAFSESVVKKLTDGLAKMAEQRGVAVVQGTARFSSPHSVTVEHNDESHDISFDQAIIAAGARATTLPELILKPDHDDPRIMDSTGALALDAIPEKLLVVGGGIIGLEMATIYDAFGSRVSVVEMQDQLMPGVDSDLVRPLLKRIKPRYEAIHLNTTITAVEMTRNTLSVSFDGDKAPASDDFDAMLIAIGRQPNGDRIAADRAGVRVDERGFIPVDDQMRSNIPHIFAIGDINGEPLLAHKASHEGKVAAEVACGEKSGFEDRVIPALAYTDPEVAWAGLTETAAKQQGIDYDKGVFPWAASGRALGLGRDEGMTKILFDKQTQCVLGIGMTGPHAGDLIAEGVLAIEMGADARDLALTIHPHPTLSETIGFAAEAFEGTITDLYLPRRNK